MWISSVQKGERIEFCNRSEFQMFLLISDRHYITVSLSGTQLWRFHTELCKFLQNILTANSSTKNRKDLRLGKVDKLLISYNITNSCLFLSNGFDFIFSLRDSENHPQRTRELLVHSVTQFRTLNRSK